MPSLMPKDLSDAWWEKNKAKTLKSADFTKALKSYNKKRAQAVDGSGARLEAFADYETAYRLLKDARAKTERACTKGIHEETRECLKAYQKMIEADHANVGKTMQDYRRAFEDLDSKAGDLGKILEAFKKEAVVLFKSFDSVDRTVHTGSGTGQQGPMEFRLSPGYDAYLKLRQRLEAIDGRLAELSKTFRLALAHSAVTDKDLKTSAAVSACRDAVSSLATLLKMVKDTDRRIFDSLP